MQAGQRSGPRSVAQFERFRCDRNQTEVLVRLPDLLESKQVIAYCKTSELTLRCRSVQQRLMNDEPECQP